jgi:hypothetical protein
MIFRKSRYPLNIAQAKEWFCEEGKKSELRAAFADNA